MQELFTWVPFYETLANQLISWRDRQGELIQLLDELRAKGLAVMPLVDIDSAGSKVPLTEIDPFTMFALFNRGLTDANRQALAAALGEALGVEAPPPVAFAGIPVVHNQSTWFFAFARDRKPTHIPSLWNLFEQALGPAPLDSPDFRTAFDAALTQPNIRFNLTIGLFWVRPRIFVSLDRVVREYAGVSMRAMDLTADRYISENRRLAELASSFPALSYDAWLAASATPQEARVDTSPSAAGLGEDEADSSASFWFVGAKWPSGDQTERFLSEGIWENGIADKRAIRVDSMRSGERIAIKATYTRKNDLPFDANGQHASVMAIKAIGTIIKNEGNGARIHVQWQQRFDPPREWYFYVYQGAIWRVKRGKPYNDLLIRFAFEGADQDYDWFLNQPHWVKWLGGDEGDKFVKETRAEPVREKAEAEADGEVREVTAIPYTIDDVINEGVFLSRNDVEALIHLLREQKNLILQGPPGVGKTFLAKKLGYALLGSRDESRVSRVQFHQSMSYEDFVRGLRPMIGGRGFAIVDGPFVEMAENARVSPDDQEFVLIIEEINRGNPSAIFGELLTLLERDKRDPENAIRLTHHRQGELPFYVPPNVYIIGTLNLADRSLATLDYALRRRFAFESLRPVFDAAYIMWCEKQGLAATKAAEIGKRLTIVNEVISADPTLGPDFAIGHSFFCPRPADVRESATTVWFTKVVEKQVVPLLQQYWFDNTKQVEEMRTVLLSAPL